MCPGDCGVRLVGGRELCAVCTEVYGSVEELEAVDRAHGVVETSTYAVNAWAMLYGEVDDDFAPELD